MTCEHTHGFVVADGRCGGCGTVVAASGPFDADHPTGVRFLAPPFATDADARCRAGGDHLPDSANGVCVACSTQLVAFSEPDIPDDPGLRWFETPY